LRTPRNLFHSGRFCGIIDSSFLSFGFITLNQEDFVMDVSYNKLFKLLIDKELKKTEFAKAVGISANTMAKLSHNETVSMDVIVKICRYLKCSVDDIMDVLPETRVKE